MARQIINLGVAANDRTGDELREGGQKIEANFEEIYAGANSTIEQKTTASYTLTLADAGKYLRMTNADAKTVTIPNNTSVPYLIGTEIALEQTGADQITVSPAVNVTLNGNNKTADQYAVVVLKKVATNTWTIIGGIE